ncbi:SDR family NAD(P)-dependent oxidoreductase [Flavobacterium sp. LHD-85]|uniref:SDR family oxidoreductase n=1 Tax=Flavobacterium sp. LHD-85 TaxID=3071410 RepID=UPI0027E17B6D|nr:SDR family NAD(P)-dependent oxidoreductase [Flavobacterium sp. LHD-85]MDQ6527599.1 SDR family NAD(P)-dependent oxidoreductase [Flavobacterium sp. LHD-85]
MEISNSTIVITGGSSGLGFEMCQQFIERGNNVITCSRSLEKLEDAKKRLPGLVIYKCDIARELECEDFAEWLRINYPKMNVLINNAAIVNKTYFVEDQFSLEKMNDEFSVNLNAPIRLIKLLYPILIQNQNPKIINITTGLVYVPRVIYPFYNAAKVGLHSFTQVLREQLKQEKKVRIIEVLFPVVDTPWHKGNPPKIAISPQKAVSEMLERISQNQVEIRIAKVKMLYFLFRVAPRFAFQKINSL